MKKLCYILTIFIQCNMSLAEGLMDSMAISAAGIEVQSKRMSIIAQNIANADATGILPGTSPYRRKTIFFKLTKDQNTGIELVKISKIGHDRSDFRMKFDPTHPAANRQGYVLYPNVDPLIESKDAKETERSFDANLKAMEVTKNMINKTFDILR